MTLAESIKKLKDGQSSINDAGLLAAHGFSIMDVVARSDDTYGSLVAIAYFAVECATDEAGADKFIQFMETIADGY